MYTHMTLHGYRCNWYVLILWDTMSGFFSMVENITIYITFYLTDVKECNEQLGLWHVGPWQYRMRHFVVRWLLKPQYCTFKCFSCSEIWCVAQQHCCQNVSVVGKLLTPISFEFLSSENEKLNNAMLKQLQGSVCYINCDAQRLYGWKDMALSHTQVN